MKLKILLCLTAVALLIFSLFLWRKKPRKEMFRQVTFKQLPRCEIAKLTTSLAAFQSSCRVFVEQNPENVSGTEKR